MLANPSWKVGAPGSAPGNANVSYPESEYSSKFVTSSASLHIYNAQTKGAQHKSMVKIIDKIRRLHLLVKFSKL